MQFYFTNDDDDAAAHRWLVLYSFSGIKQSEPREREREAYSWQKSLAISKVVVE